MVRIGRAILVTAFVVGCSSSSSSVSPDAADAAAERLADSNGNARDASGDVDGDCTPATAFTCVASCASAAPTPLICDDGHWECERGVDARQCADAGP
jgi:hypothetical protein